MKYYNHSHTFCNLEVPNVDLQIDLLELSDQSNRISCRIHNGTPATLSLWYHRDLLVKTNLTQIEYVLPPYQYGQYTCQFMAISKTSLVREKGKDKNRGKNMVL